MENTIVRGPQRRRYIAFSLQTPNNTAMSLDKQTLIAHINHQLHALHPQLTRTPRISIVRFNGTQGILRCTNHTKDMAITALTSLHHINSYTFQIRPLGTTGSIKGAVTKYVPQLQK